MIAAAGLAAALGVPGAVLASGQAAPAAQEQQAAQTQDLIECPLTGETIPPCCCPVKDED